VVNQPGSIDENIRILIETLDSPQRSPKQRIGAIQSLKAIAETGTLNQLTRINQAFQRATQSENTQVRTEGIKALGDIVPYLQKGEEQERQRRLIHHTWLEVIRTQWQNLITDYQIRSPWERFGILLGLITISGVIATLVYTTFSLLQHAPIVSAVIIAVLVLVLTLALLFVVLTVYLPKKTSPSP